MSIALKISKMDDVLDLQKHLMLSVLPELENGKTFECQIKPFKPKRSLDANAYFHVLVGKIAAKLGVSNDEIKTKLNLDYGTIAEDENGVKVGFKALDSVPITSFFKYAKPIGTVEENGKTFVKYLVYKETSKLSSGEMAVLIDGAMYEARSLGIDACNVM